MSQPQRRVRYTGHKDHTNRKGQVMSSATNTALTATLPTPVLNASTPNSAYSPAPKHDQQWKAQPRHRNKPQT